MASKDYYSASQSLRAAQNNIRYDIFDVNSAPKPLNTAATKTTAPTATN